MLPNFRTAQEKKMFVEALYNIFMGQESINKYVNASDEESEKQQAMYKAELDPHLDTEEDGPANDIVALTERGVEIIESLKNLTSANPNDEAFEKNWNALNAALESANNKNDPFKPVNDYLAKYGMKKLNNPVIKMHMEMAQAISDSANYSLLATNPVNAENDRLYDDIIREHQKVIDETSEELSQFCVENKIEAGAVYSGYKNMLDFMNNLKESIRENLEASEELESESAQKITDYLVADDRLTRVQNELREIAPKMDLTLPGRLQNAADIANAYITEQAVIMKQGKQIKADDVKETIEKMDKQIIAQERVIFDHENSINEYRKSIWNEEQINTYCAEIDAEAKLKASLETLKNLSEKEQLNRMLQDVRDGKDPDIFSPRDREVLTAYETAKDNIRDAVQKAGRIDIERLDDYFNKLEDPKNNNNVCKAICNDKDGLIQDRLKYIRKDMRESESANPLLEKYVKEIRKLNEAKIKLQELNREKEHYEERVRQYNEQKKQGEEAVKNYKYLVDQSMKCFGLISDLDLPSAEDLDPKNCGKLIKIVSQTQKELLPRYNNLVEDEAESKAAFNTAKNGLKGVRIPKNLAKDLGEKIKEVNRKGDRLRVYSAGIKKADKIVNAIANKSIAESGKQYESKIKVETQRREAIGNTLKEYLQTHLSEGNAKKNSPAYNDLRKNLKEVADAFDVNSKLSNKERADKIADLRSAAEKYLAEKGKQWRPFPSEQRVSRLQGAENVLKFCSDLEKTVRNTPDISIDKCRKSLGTIVNVEDAQEQMKKIVGKKVNTIKKAAEQATMKASVQNKKNVVVSNMK